MSCCKCPSMDVFFFYFKQCFQRRVDWNGMEMVYKYNKEFRKFINQTSALFSSIEDIEEGLDLLDKRFIFVDKNVESFKKKFVQYISQFWIDGCLPLRVWSTFTRSQDKTNNTQKDRIADLIGSQRESPIC